MLFSLKKFSFVTAIIAAIVLAISVATASADGAFVVNHGNNPGTTCNATIFGWYGVGSLDLVLTPSDNMHYGCSLQGPAIDQTMVVDIGGYHIVIAKSGQAHLTFNG